MSAESLADMENYFKFVFEDIMQLETSNIELLVLDSISMPADFRVKLSEIFFENLRLQSINFTLAMTTLFQAIQFGDISAANRIVMAPLTRDRAGPAQVPTDMMTAYYTQRAAAGLIITEATQISAEGQGYLDTPGLYSPAQVAGWRRITDALHAAGGKIDVQPWDGRQRLRAADGTQRGGHRPGRSAGGRHAAHLEPRPSAAAAELSATRRAEPEDAVRRRRRGATSTT